MTITPLVDTDNPTPTPIESNGVGLLPEEADGSGDIANGNPPKPLGTITDNKNSTNKAVYEIAMGYDATPDNVNFNIEDNTLYYLGANAGDFETAGVKKSFTITIVRYNNEADAGAKRSPQIFEYIVNLKNLNDNKPTDLVGNVGDTETEITDYIAAGNVGDGKFAMAFNLGPDQEALGTADDKITIEFYHLSGEPVLIEPQYFDTNNPDVDEVIGFRISTASIWNYGELVEALTDKSSANNATSVAKYPTASDDFDIWIDYLLSVKYKGASPTDVPLNSSDSLFVSTDLTKTKGIVVESGATGNIANFDSTDADGDTLKYSLVGTDSDDFTIDAATGKLSFKTPPNFTSPADANSDNTYEVTIKVSDGLPANDKTYDLLVVVIEVTE